MASANPVFRDGGSNNKPPLFCAEYFDFWKIRMKAHLEEQGEDIWDAVQNGMFVPTSIVDGVGITKIKSSWNEDDKKKVLYDKKTYVAWDDSEISSSSDEDHAYKSLMVSHHSSDEEHEVSDCKTNDIPSYDELQSVFHELHDELLKLSRKCSSKKKSILNLERKSNSTQVELDLIKNSACNNYSSLESKIIKLKQVIVKFEKCQIDVENVLSSKKIQMINMVLALLTLIILVQVKPHL